MDQTAIPGNPAHPGWL